MIALLAQYNEWMNSRLYAAAATLPAEALATDRGAFFGSIMGTLNHLVVADIIWLKRFAAHPATFRCLDPVRVLPMPSSLDAQMSGQLPLLAEQRRVLDAAILRLADEIKPEHLGHVLEYASMKGIAGRKRFDMLLQHFFNHQTHHRGQATTLLSQAGVDVGATDLLLLVPDAEP